MSQSRRIKELITATKAGMQIFLLPGDRLLCVCLSVCRMDLWCSLQGVSVSTRAIRASRDKWTDRLSVERFRGEAAVGIPAGVYLHLRQAWCWTPGERSCRVGLSSPISPCCFPPRMEGIRSECHLEQTPRLKPSRRACEYKREAEPRDRVVSCAGTCQSWVCLRAKFRRLENGKLWGAWGILVVPGRVDVKIAGFH